MTAEFYFNYLVFAPLLAMLLLLLQGALQGNVRRILNNHLTLLLGQFYCCVTLFRRLPLPQPIRFELVFSYQGFDSGSSTEISWILEFASLNFMRLGLVFLVVVTSLVFTLQVSWRRRLGRLSYVNLIRGLGLQQLLSFVALLWVLHFCQIPVDEPLLGRLLHSLMPLVLLPAMLDNLRESLEGGAFFRQFAWEVYLRVWLKVGLLLVLMLHCWLNFGELLQDTAFCSVFIEVWERFLKWLQDFFPR